MIAGPEIHDAISFDGKEDFVFGRVGENIDSFLQSKEFLSSPGDNSATIVGYRKL
jgi:hypothetical protein